MAETCREGGSREGVTSTGFRSLDTPPVVGDAASQVTNLRLLPVDLLYTPVIHEAHQLAVLLSTCYRTLACPTTNPLANTRLYDLSPVTVCLPAKLPVCVSCIQCYCVPILPSITICNIFSVYSESCIRVHSLYCTEGRFFVQLSSVTYSTFNCMCLEVGPMLCEYGEREHTNSDILQLD